MNQERIQELINECTMISDDLVYDGESWHMKTYEYFDKEKFARLIIRECMSLAQSHPSQIEDYAAGIDSVRENIKEHFGIKE